MHLLWGGEVLPKQLDIFGNEIDCNEIYTQQPNRKYKTMQEIYGYRRDQTCKDCKHKIKLKYHGRVYYKCSLWRLSKSSATDIRLKNIACNKWEQGECEFIDVWY